MSDTIGTSRGTNTDRPVISARGLRGGYGPMEVLHGVDLDVAAGETVALLGPNGAGKTTFLQLVVGFLPLSGGNVEILGAPLTGRMSRQVRKRVAVVPDEHAVIRSLSVRDNLLLGRGGVDAAVAIFPELGELLGRSAGLLSGGEQRMLTVSRALAANPRVFVADEISLGLAPLVVQRLITAIREYVTASGAAALLVEQQARSALKVADRWYLMRGGRILVDSTMAEADRLLDEHYLFGTINSSKSAGGRR